MTVIHIVARFDIGGAERVAINLAKSTEASVHIVEVFRGNGSMTQALLQECSDAGIIVHRSEVTNTKAAILTFPNRFHRIMKHCVPDVIHTHTEVPDLSLYLFRVFHPHMLDSVRIVRTIHNTRLWSRWKLIGRVVENWFQHIQANVSIGKGVSESYVREWGKEPDALVYNGLDEVRQSGFDGIEEGKLNILFAGRLEPYKGISILIELVKRYPRYVFHIWGSGTMQSVVNFELSSFTNVHLYKAIPAISSKMASFDYLIMPSYFEGLALCSIEASLAGCPVIANDCPGLGETLPPDWPLLVRDNSIEQYCKLLDELESMDRVSLSASVRAYAKEHFRLDRMVSGYMDFYKNATR